MLPLDSGSENLLEMCDGQCWGAANLKFFQQVITSKGPIAARSVTPLVGFIVSGGTDDSIGDV